MGVLNAATNAVGNVVLAKLLGLEGLALATSLVYVVVAIVFWVRFEARLEVLRKDSPDMPREEAA